VNIELVNLIVALNRIQSACIWDLERYRRLGR